jgi:hypothetical protein
MLFISGSKDKGLKHKTPGGNNRNFRGAIAGLFNF